MKKLPLGIQSFSKVIKQNLLYVDKTQLIHELINSGDYFFLSRPRRFGKSLLVSILKEIFEGNKELFKGLYIYDKHDWTPYPVIHIDFSFITYSEGKENFHKSIQRFVRKIGKEHNVNLEGEDVKELFKDLIQKLSLKNKVVILIDEYDKPIIDHITDLVKASENREVLREFYSVLKGSDQYIKFALITGISKFAKVSVFSGLNNLEDITLDKRFNSLCGITQEELENYFVERIKILSKEEKKTKDKLLTKIMHWYNGYSWDGKTTLYNPFSLINLFTKNEFRNYWFETATPTFLINLIKTKKYNITEIEKIEAGPEIFESFDIDNINLKPLLFQTGYLTIKNVIKDEITDLYRYTLSYPNFEVKESLLKYVLASFIDYDVSDIQPVYQDMLAYLKNKDIENFMKIVKSIFAKIPYSLHIPREAYYHSIFYIILILMGAKIDAEVLTDKGRIDGVIELDDKVYVVEFKYGKSKIDMNKLLDGAVKQINDKKYYEKYLNTNKQIILLAVGFVDKKIDFKINQPK